MKTGIFRAGYNVQLGESDEYIRNITVIQDRNDSHALIPFLESYHSRYQEYPSIAAADSGYGIYSNYLYCLNHRIMPAIKYPLYEREKTVKFRKQRYRSENLLQKENGKLFCPRHREFIYQRDETDKHGEFKAITQIWQCATCNRCPYAKQCKKSSGPRTVQVNVVMNDIRKETRELLDSPAGIELRQQRCIQAEGAFGIIKNDWNYDRLHRRGMNNVDNELYLVCMGYNLRKYYQKQLRKSLS